MDNKELELFTITSEECAELTVAMSKISRFGHSETSINNLKQELGDVFCMIALFVDAGYLDFEELQGLARNKSEKLREWSNLDIPEEF